MLLRSLTKHVRDQNWFAVALDFLIVVLGILLAFQITNWSEARQQNTQTEQAIESIEAELSILLFLSSERLANEPCRFQKIRALSGKLADDGDAWEPDLDIDEGPALSEFAMPRMLRTPMRPWPDEAWKTLMASETALHLDRAEFNQLSIIFDMARETDQLDEMAWRLRGQLSHLALPGTLSTSERRSALKTLGELASIGDLIFINAGELRNEIIDLGYDHKGAKALLQKQYQYNGLDAAIRDAKSVYGDCLNLTEFQPIFDLVYTHDGDPKTIQELLKAAP
jgi:hypothetical protein